MGSERKGTVHWEGRGKEGKGRIGTESGALADVSYGFATRFEDDKRGTNPEELIAAAHASCFTMAFSFACDKAGFATESVDTTASVRLVSRDGGFAIDRITLEMRASVPGLDEAKFQEIAQGAKAGCPVSKALAGVPDIRLTATLVQRGGERLRSHVDRCGCRCQRA
ncbi:OsmC family protein [Piscinibacter koreensis]|uniref:OsmC family protein n=1 Tax=Piscinibacter koreensis TaxID=2742824 RepID=A0A7Y6NNR8_9BURK|nr:OsmC family protein [Schlegelella koreensis]NUZ06580.1 OsmC family protein [Schlegelella koreensis]